MKYLLLAMALMAACAEPSPNECPLCADYSEAEDTDDALQMCENDLNESIDDYAEIVEENARLRAIIDSQLVESHECRGALIECGCSGE